NAGDLAQKGGNTSPAAAANDPDVAPQKTLPQIVEQYKADRDKARIAEKNARDAEKDATNKRDRAVKLDAEQKASFDGEIAKLTAKVADFQKDLQAKYDGLVAKHRNDNVKADEQIKKQGADIKERDDILVKKEDQLKDLKALNDRNKLIIAGQN